MSREWEDKPQNWEKISIFNTSGLPGGSDGKESWVWFLGWEDSLEKGMASYSSILAWETTMDRRAWPATVHGVAESDTNEGLNIHNTMQLIKGCYQIFAGLLCLNNKINQLKNESNTLMDTSSSKIYRWKICI